jgi:WD40 repeat protein
LWSSAAAPALPGSLAAAGSDVPGHGFSPDGRLLAVSADVNPQGRTGIWDVANAHHPVVAYTFPRQWNKGAFIGDGKTLITQNGSGTEIALWDLRDPRHPTHESQLAGVGVPTVSNDGRMLAVATDDYRAVSVFDITDPRRPRPDGEIPVRHKGENFQVFTHLLNDTMLLVWVDGRANVWKVGGAGPPRRLHSLDGPQNISGLAYDDTTHLLALWDYQGPLAMWDLKDPRHAVSIESGTISAKVQSAGFIGKDTLGVATANDSSITLWDVGHAAAHPQRIGVVTGDGEMSGFSLSPDLRSLAAQPSYGGQAHLWDVGNPAHPSDEGALPDPYAHAGEFSPDGRTLAMTKDQLSGGGSGIRLTDYKAEDAYRYLCSLGPHPVTRTHWEQVVGRIHSYRRPCGI